MKRSLFFLFMLCTCLSMGQVVTKVPKSGTNAYGFVKVEPSYYDPAKKWRLEVFLHGRGGKGDGSDTEFGLNRLTRGELPPELVAAAEKYGFVVLAPQVDVDYWPVAATNHVVAYAKQNLSIDWTVNRNQITGLSMGGGGVWAYISSSVTNANNFASAVVVCGVSGISNAQNIVDSKIAVWAFHAKNDGTVGYSSTVNSVKQINDRKPVVPAYMTLYETGDHWIWGKVYDPNGKPGLNYEPVGIYEWAAMNEVGKPAPVPQQGPVNVTAKAALKFSNQLYFNDTTVAIPTLTLDGTASVGYKSAGWSVVSVPPGVSIWAPIITSGGGWITGSASLPKEGTYTLRLTVKDADGKAVHDDIVVTYQKDGTPPAPDPKKELGRIFVPKLNLFVVVYDDGTTAPLQ